MLQTNKAATEPGTADFEVMSPAQTLHEAIGFLRRQYTIIVFAALLSVALGAVYLFTAPPRFTAEAAMIIDTRKVQLMQQQSVVGDLAVDASTVESQVHILQSENVIQAVIKDLRLTEDPEFVGPGTGLLSVVLGFVKGIGEIFGSAEPPSEYELQREAVERFRDKLTVKRIGLTYVMNIQFQSLNADRAAQIANAAVDAYIVDQLEAKYQATRRASIWLQERIRDLRQQASTAEQAVIDYKIKNNIVDAGGGRLTTEQQLAEVNSQLVQARAATAEAKARLERIEQITRLEIPDATVADSLRNEVVIRLRSQYLENARREADWSARYGHDHLAAVNLRNQMREIRRSIVDELKRTAETYKSDYEIAKAREESIQKSMADVIAQTQTANQAQLMLRELEGTAQTYRVLHDNFLQRYMESVQQQSFPITEARLISPATRPLKKSHPKTLLVLALALGGGIFLGAGIGFLRDLADRVFRTSRQVKDLLGLNCLTILPALKPPQPANGGDRIAWLRGRGAPPPPHEIPSRPSYLASVVEEPFSRFAEAMRAVKIAIDLEVAKRGEAREGKVIAVTSALPNEGKSTVATNLARLIAMSGGRVALLDCDLRNPSLTRALAPQAKAGILEIMAGSAATRSVFCNDAATSMVFVPAVINTRLAHTSDIFASERAKALFEALRKEFDYVIADLSPMAPVVDVRVTSHLVDSYIFVVEWGRTKIDVVEHALQSADHIYDQILGVVLNKADMRSFGRYQNYAGSYYYNQYYARYGYVD